MGEKRIAQHAGHLEAGLVDPRPACVEQCVEFRRVNGHPVGRAEHGHLDGPIRSLLDQRTALPRGRDQQRQLAIRGDLPHHEVALLRQRERREPYHAAPRRPPRPGGARKELQPRG